MQQNEQPNFNDHLLRGFAGLTFLLLLVEMELMLASKTPEDAKEIGGKIVLIDVVAMLNVATLMAMYSIGCYFKKRCSDAEQQRPITPLYRQRVIRPQTIELAPLNTIQIEPASGLASTNTSEREVAMKSKPSSPRILL